MAGYRDAREEEHQAPWLEHNPNKDVCHSSKLEKEKDNLVEGLTLEDYKTYELEAIHILGNPKIVALNRLILKKVNSMVENRIEYKRVLIQGGPTHERDLAVKNLSNLRKQIVELQAAVENGGVAFFKIPKKFDDVPDH